MLDAVLIHMNTPARKNCLMGGGRLAALASALSSSSASSRSARRPRVVAFAPQAVLALREHRLPPSLAGIGAEEGPLTA